MTAVHISIDAESADEALHHMRILLGASGGVSAPAVSDSSSDNTKQTTEQPAVSGEVTTPNKPQRVSRKKATVTDVILTNPLAISTGGERTDPETTQQDAADEAAETTTAEDAPLTLDDVRNSALPYITKWGKEAAAKDLVPIVMAAGGVPNIGKLDPTDQALLRKVMTAFADAAKADKRFEA